MKNLLVELACLSRCPLVSFDALLPTALCVRSTEYVCTIYPWMLCAGLLGMGILANQGAWIDRVIVLKKRKWYLRSTVCGVCNHQVRNT